MNLEHGGCVPALLMGELGLGILDEVVPYGGPVPRNFFMSYKIPTTNSTISNSSISNSTGHNS